MTYRVYIHLEERIRERAHDIGACIVAYIEYRLKLRVILHQFSSEKRELIVYTISTDEEEATRIYELLRPNRGAGVIREIVLTQGYRTDNRTIGDAKGDVWRGRYYRAMSGYFLFALRKNPGTFGREIELSTTIKSMGL